MLLKTNRVESKFSVNHVGKCKICHEISQNILGKTERSKETRRVKAASQPLRDKLIIGQMSSFVWFLTLLSGAVKKQFVMQIRGIISLYWN